MLFHTKCISVPIMLVAFYYSFLLVLVEFRIAQKRLVTSYPDISRMTAVFAGIVVACFLYRSVCGQNSGWKSFSVENFALPDHKYKIITSISFSKCRNFCKSERACVSVNFQGSTELKGCCALNSRGVEEEEKIHKSLVFTPGCTFQQLRDTGAAIAEVHCVLIFLFLC